MPQLNRRQFTLAAAAATTACAFPVHAQDPSENPDPDENLSPSETLGVAVCGVNSRGGEHMRGFHVDPRTKITVIVDIDEQVGYKAAEWVKERQGQYPVVVKDVREALDRDDVQLLSCATPNHWHALIGIWAMQAGKDVYVEKPISFNIHEGRALVAAADRYGRMVQTGTQCRSSQAVMDAIAFIRDGGIGEVNFARGLCYKRRKSIGALGDYPIPEGVDFNLWSGPAPYTDPKLTRPQFHYDWHWQRLYGNGDLGNQGPHQTDIARWGLGVDRHPNSVITYGGRLGYKAEREDPNYVDAGDTANTEVSIYDYGDKSLVFETRGLDVSDSAGEEIDLFFADKDGNKSKGNKIGVIFYGTEGYVVQLSYGLCRAFDLDKNMIREFKAGGYGDGHFANFIDACQSRDYGSLNADAKTGHLSAAVSHLGNISYYLGEENRVAPEELKAVLANVQSGDDNLATLQRTIDHLVANGVDLESTPLSLGPQLAFDPEAERFIDDDAANEMLSREYRDGFVCPDAENV